MDARALAGAGRGSNEAVVQPDSSARIVFDRDTGRPRLALVHRNVTRYRSADHETVVDRYRVRTRIRFVYGTDLRRPAPLRRPTPLEVLIDAAEF